MKTLALLCTVVAVTLAGCKTEQATDKNEPSSIASAEASTNVIVKSPDGRWFSNPLHCSGKMPVTGTYDFTVSGNTLTYIGIGDNGRWLDDSQNEQARKAFTEKLSADSQCLSNASLSDFQMVKFDGQVTEYFFAYSEKNNVLLRFNGGVVEVIVPFDVEKIKTLSLEDNNIEELRTLDNEPTEAASDDKVKTETTPH